MPSAGLRAPAEASLHRIAINTAVSYQRKANLRTIGSVLRRLGRPGAGPDPAQVALDKELTAALRRLAPKLRAALVLRHYPGYTNREIAAPTRRTQPRQRKRRPRRQPSRPRKRRTKPVTSRRRPVTTKPTKPARTTPLKPPARTTTAETTRARATAATRAGRAMIREGRARARPSFLSALRRHEIPDPL